MYINRRNTCDSSVLFNKVASVRANSFIKEGLLLLTSKNLFY